MPLEVRATGENRYCLFHVGTDDGEYLESGLRLCFSSAIHAHQVSEAVNSEVAYQEMEMRRSMQDESGMDQLASLQKSTKEQVIDLIDEFNKRKEK